MYIDVNACTHTCIHSKCVSVTSTSVFLSSAAANSNWKSRRASVSARVAVSSSISAYQEKEKIAAVSYQQVKVCKGSQQGGTIKGNASAATLNRFRPPFSVYLDN